MIIPIDETTRIAGTANAWELQRFCESKTGKTPSHWKAIGYHTSFQSVLNRAVALEIRTDDANGIREAIEACDRIVAKYSKLFDREVKAASKLEAA